MRVDYRALAETASALRSASEEVRSEREPPGELGALAVGPDGEYTAAQSLRRHVIGRLGGLMELQSDFCGETILIFQALDAQIASQITH